MEIIGKILTAPLRTIMRIFRGGAKAGVKNSARSGNAAKTTMQGGGSVVAKLSADELLDDEYREEPPRGFESIIFRQLPRPRLVEKTAAELTLEQAREYAVQAKRFYEFPFPLFPRGDFFYEEIEEDYLAGALGVSDKSIDARFVEVVTLFRRILNQNTRRLMLYWTPLIGAATFAATYFAEPVLASQNFFGLSSALGNNAVIYGGAAVFAAAIAFLIYSWPYKVVQQRNLMNLDNYVTSKFARINNNFQVAKRRALNVERAKRMSERDELREEASAWTLGYHWFAVRLFLCETMLRNKFYQVRRNTTLYWVGGMLGSLILFGAIFFATEFRNSANSAIIALTGGIALYSIIAWSVMRRATGMMFGVLETNEWSRFHRINLDTTIGDHVGEDKLQIVTFRDRNRFE
ncbi:MAG: hypothetical protein HKN14_05200 [Marinicaulis sp.]|nr:hypothetical protein [Marinicaulis sp.]NNL89875.1 hypothetical protein [Marinicaulis sp.]